MKKLKISSVLSTILDSEDRYVYYDYQDSNFYFYALGFKIDLIGSGSNAVTVNFNYETQDKSNYKRIEHNLSYTVSFEEIKELLDKVIFIYDNKKITYKSVPELDEILLYNNELNEILLYNNIKKYLKGEPSEYQVKEENGTIILNMYPNIEHTILINRSLEKRKQSECVFNLLELDVFTKMINKEGKVLNNMITISIPAYDLHEYSKLHSYVDVKVIPKSEEDFLKSFEKIEDPETKIGMQYFLLNQKINTTSEKQKKTTQINKI